MPGANRKYTGFLLTEMMVSTAVIGLLLTAMALSLRGFAKFNRYQLVSQRCIAAAQAQLDCITATGEAIADDDFQRLWPDVTVSVEKSPGAGRWDGTTLVEATARGESFGKEIKVSLSRYVPGSVTLREEIKQKPPAKEDP